MPTNKDIKLEIGQLLDIVRTSCNTVDQLMKVVDNPLYSEYEQGVALMVLQEMLPKFREFCLGGGSEQSFMRGFT